MDKRNKYAFFLNRPQNVLRIVGFLVSIVPLPVLFGWNKANNYFSSWTLMQFNTALSLLGLGISFLFLSLGKFRIVRALSCFIIALASATVCQFIFGIDLGIDQLFRSAHSTVLRYPGRMAPNTAVSLLACGTSVLILAIPNVSGPANLVAGLSGALALGLGLIKIISQFFGIAGSLDPGSYLHMALPTAVGVGLSGAFIVASVILKFKTNSQDSYRIRPFFVTLGSICVVFFIWQMLLNQEMGHIQNLTRLRAEGIKLEVERRLESATGALRRFATRLEYLGTQDKSFIGLDAKSYLDQISVFRRIGLIDPDSRVSWSYPLQISSQVYHYNQSNNPVQKRALEESLRLKSPVMSGMVELLSNERGFIIPVPMYRHEKLMGFVYASVIAERLFDGIANAEGFRLEAKEGDTSFYESSGKDGVSELSVHTVLQWGLASIEIDARPRLKFIAENKSSVPYLTLAIGVLISLMVGFFLQKSALASQREKEHLAILNDAIEKMSRAEQFNTFYKLALDKAAIVAFTDVRGKITYVNEMFCRISKYSADELLGKDHRLLNSGTMGKEFFRNMWETISSGKSWNGEICNRAKDGTHYWVDTTIVPFMESDGSISRYIAIRQDVTKEKLQQLQLEELKLRLEMALEDSGIGVWDWDIVANKLVWDDQMFKIYGVRRDDFTSAYDAWANGLHPEDSERAQKEINLAISGKKSFKTEFRVRRPDGTVADVAARAKLVCDPSGNPLRMVGVNIDISDQKSLQRQVQRSNEWRRAILNAANVTIISTDKKGIIQTFNEKAEILLGYRASDVIGKVTPAIIHEKDEVVARAAELTQELGKNIEPGFEVFVAKAKMGIIEEREWTYIRKDGSKFPVLLSVSSLRNDKNEITGYLGVGTDLTERKAVEARIDQSERRLKYALEGSSDGMWDWDLVKNEMFVSEKMAVFFGGPQIISVADPGAFTQVIHPDDQKKTMESIFSHLEGKTDIHEVEARLKNAAGEYIWMLTRGKISERDEQGRATRMTGVHINIHILKEAQEKLKAAEARALAAAEVKAQFLASMSHEIRTPLNAIIGMADLTLKTELGPEQRQFVDIIQQSGSSLLSIVNDVLDFSKIESGKMDLSTESFSLAYLVESQAEILSVKAAQKKISLMTYVSPTLPLEVKGDSGRLGQILLNLIGNALKFTSSGGVVARVTESSRKNNLSDNFLWVRFEVQDTGIGLSESDQRRLFQPFTQASGAINKKYGGTGLGLSISKRLVEAMNGEVGVDSVVGKGSTFWLEIPFEVSAAGSFVTTKEKLKDLYGFSALIVDDDLVAQKTIHDYIDSWKMRNGTISSHGEAISLLKKKIDENDAYSIVLIGSGSSGKEGLTLGQDIKRELGAKAPKLILMQPFGTGPDVDASVTSCFSDVVTKPIKQSHLFDAFVNAIFGHLEADRAGNKTGNKVTDQDLNKQEFRVLIADDVVVNQLLTRKLLERLGYSSVTVANGLEVLDAITRSKFDLILMDCQMPEMDGFEATAKVREKEKLDGSHIPIIALTANAMSGDDKRCFAAGMDDYIAKPIKEQILKEKLELWLLNKDKPSAKKVA